MQSKFPRQRVSHRRLRCMLAQPCIRHLARPVTAACLQAFRVRAPHRRALARLFYVGLTHGSRVSFAHTRVSIVGWIYDPDHSLPPGMYVDVPHLDCLLIAALITVERLDHIILKSKQLDGVTTVYVDVVFGHLAMALSKKS